MNFTESLQTSALLLRQISSERLSSPGMTGAPFCSKCDSRVDLMLEKKDRIGGGSTVSIAIHCSWHTHSLFFCLASCLLGRCLREARTDRWKPGGVRVWLCVVKRPLIPKGPQGGEAFLALSRNKSLKALFTLCCAVPVIVKKSS